MPPVSIGARTLARELPTRTGERVLLQGWVHHTRNLSAVDFLLLRDRTGIAQVVIESPKQRDLLASLPHESVVALAARRLSGIVWS